MSAPLAYDASYLKSISGVLKICCLVCCFLGFLCIVSSSVHLSNFRGWFYIACVIVSFICSLLILLARLFQLWQRKCLELNAVKGEFYLHVSLALCCFIAGCVSISLDVLAYTIAAFFALLAFCFYAFDGYLSYRLNRVCDAQTQTQMQPQMQPQSQPPV